MAVWFDTHAHLDDERFDDCRDAVVAAAEAAGVRRVVCVGTSVEASETCLAIAKQYASVFAAVGIQPNHVDEAEADAMDRIVALSADPQVVAIGETGLDRYWDRAPFDLQIDYFRRHVELSAECGKPFIVHMRECESDTAEFFAEMTRRGVPLRGVMHSYTGGPELQQQCLDAGMYVSFAGMVTYKKSLQLRETVRRVPLNRLLIETDAPYLSPEPKRGVRPNTPAMVVHTGRCLADVFGVSEEQLAEVTTANACEFFQLAAD